MIFDLFSKRQKRLRGEIPDVFTYDEIPNILRVQIVHIWRDCLGNENEYLSHYNKVKGGYRFIVEALRREYGSFSLNKDYGNEDYMEELSSFFLQQKNTDTVLDVIELSFRYADIAARKYDHRNIHHYDEIIDNAIIELNARFKEHGVGFQYENGELIRIDSQLLHTETVKPALKLLNEKVYAGAQQEFLNAYEHYRHGKHKEALNEALKSFESTLKTICNKKGWKYDSNDTSKKLLDICFQQELIPYFWQQQMAAIRSLLEGGVPTARNKLSGHGQGSTPTAVSDHIVSYTLHMTAAAIVFLVNSEKSMK